ncbi:putative E6 protein [Equus caballus papillomavirus 7]|uniref:Protein E6 n=1 Tax=Equus caballus papillomavirus 7 TaxID=1235430 RepID=M4HXD6_9PAPI|nr:putative E6 protein [Equus caballus papillomavirus 7]AFU07689.1 putative E6 protein [Equus caballus papillomavirus 7]UJP31699.1 E6 protein [Equus caballus papillomavirus 7]
MADRRELEEDVWSDFAFLQTCPCVFCRCKLSRVDLVAFRDNQWRLIWKSGKAFAACTPCVKALLFIERTCYPTLWKSVAKVEEIEQRPVCQIKVTCHYCGHVLSTDEKLLKAWEGKPLRRLRNRWTASCFDCNHPDPELIKEEALK